jgi:hypothetical protein
MKTLPGFLVLMLLVILSFISCAVPEGMKYIDVAGAGGPGYFGNYADYGNGTQPLAFGLDSDGNLHITGVVNYTPAAAVISPPATFFRLPSGYRPTSTQYFGVTINGYASQFGLITVANDGNVYIGTSPTALDFFPLGHLVVKM